VLAQGADSIFEAATKLPLFRRALPVYLLTRDALGRYGSAKGRRGSGVVGSGVVGIMTMRPRYPFVWLGIPLALILLLTIGPLAALLLGGAVADALGCSMPISADTTCLFMGVDLSGALTIAVALGYMAFFTFPMGTTLLGIWLVAAVIVTAVWWLRRRNTI
jgi:hypothetical protein